MVRVRSVEQGWIEYSDGSRDDLPKSVRVGVTGDGNVLRWQVWCIAGANIAVATFAWNASRKTAREIIGHVIDQANMAVPF